MSSKDSKTLNLKRKMKYDEKEKEIKRVKVTENRSSKVFQSSADRLSKEVAVSYK